MRTTILGCHAGMPADGQASSGYLVSIGPVSLLLDCGPGIATALGAAMSPVQLSAVVVTHMHLDHCYDLLPVGKSLLSPHVRYPAAGGEPQRWAELDPVPLYVPAGSGQRLRQLAALFPVSTAPVLDRVFDLAFDIREYSPGARFAVGDTDISLLEMRHSAPNCGVRIESASGSVAYTGDTGVTPALVTLAGGVDLLLAEATLAETDDGPHGHLSAADAARVAQSAAARTLVLTHFRSADQDWLTTRQEEAAQIFDGPVHLARPGRRFETERPPSTDT